MTRREKIGEAESQVWKLICEQQLAMVADVDAIRVSGKPEVIGSLFEDEFRRFLRSVLPAHFSLVPGFIVDRRGNASSHYDALLVDNNYPFLASLGPHRYVMSASVVAAIELTTKLTNNKIKSIIGKADEIEEINRGVNSDDNFFDIGFYSLSVDSNLSNTNIVSEFKRHRPLLTLFILRGAKGSDGSVCWMEGGKEGRAMLLPSKSPLADFVYMHLQDSLYSMAGRSRDEHFVGMSMNDYIHWGTTKYIRETKKYSK